ncbi:amidohydrolase family protein [Streptomyces sp. NPDC029674]|uniref:amidohydrolase family protein n=1 Tax=Streptomyces sp. NPDC029674 TaxID=3365297 RepID=UPI0038513BBF
MYEPGSVAVVGGRIAAVGPAAEIDAAWRAVRTVDCRGRAVLPGFTDGHTHLFQSLARGLGEGLPIWPWLCEFMWPYSIAVGPDDARVAATLGAVEALRSGITTVVDNHYAPTDAETVLAVADAVESAGLRGAVARGMLGDRTAVAAARRLPEELFRYSTAEELELTRECLSRRPPGSRVSVWPAPLNLSYVDQKLVTGSVALAEEFNTRWHTHCCEGAKDPSSYREAYGLRPVEWLERAGLLDERATLAHAVWLDDDEISWLGERRAGVAHNPASNAYLASGVMRLRALREAGAVVSLGTDGPAAGHRQDMFEVMKQALFAQRQHTSDPAALRAEEVLELATREGGRYAAAGAGGLRVGARRTRGGGESAHVGARRTHVGGEPPHVDARRRHVGAEPTHVGGEPTCIGGESTYVDARRTHVDAKPTHVDTDPLHVSAEPTHIDAEPTHIGAEPTHVDTEPPHVSAEPPHVTAEPTHVDTEPPPVTAGSLCVGAPADLVVVALDRPHLRPLHRVVATLVYAARGADVDMTIVDGRIVFEDGRCPLVDEEALLTEVQERAEHLVERASFGGLRTPWLHRSHP